MKKENKTGLIVFIVIIVISLALAVCSFIRPRRETNRPAPSGGLNMRIPGFSFSAGRQGGKKIFGSDDYIAKLFIDGIITDETKTYNQAWLLDTIDMLTEDSHNKGILLYLNTPGGSVYQSDELYLALCEYKHETDRPVYAYITEMAASGGYYIACAADKIFGNRNGLTGSIGVIFGASLDATEFLQKIGIKTKTFHAGKNKTMLNYDEPLTEEQEAIMQSIADEAYDQFTEIVSESRNMPIEKVRELADGRIYTTTQAQANGLIDGVCTFDEAVDHLIDDFELDDDIAVEDYAYEYTDTFTSFFGNLATHIPGVNALAKHFAAAGLSAPAYYFQF